MSKVVKLKIKDTKADKKDNIDHAMDLFMKCYRFSPKGVVRHLETFYNQKLRKDLENK